MLLTASSFSANPALQQAINNTQQRQQHVKARALLQQAKRLHSPLLAAQAKQKLRQTGQR